MQVHWHDAIDEFLIKFLKFLEFAIAMQFLMFGEFYDDENKWVIYLWFIIRIGYVRILLFVFGLCVYQKTSSISHATGNSISLPYDKPATSMFSKTNCDVKENEFLRLDSHK